MFSGKLYKEGLRRSLFVAVLFLAIMLLGATLIPMGTLQSQIRAVENGWSTGRTMVDGFGNNVTLVIAMIGMAPIMTLFQFAFLNKRAASDFYHSLPHRRETVFVSFLASTLTWVLGGIWLSTGVTIGIYAFGAQYVAMNVPTMLLVSFGVSMGALLVVAATLIAMSVTGTIFSNIVTTGLILFLPRTILFAFTQTVSDLTRVVLPESFGIFGGSVSNIPFGATFGFLIGTVQGVLRFESVFIQGALYTGVLALLYLVAAAILLKRRKSETAGNSAQSGLVQSAIRIAVAFTVCIPAIAAIIYSIQPNGHLQDALILIFAFYAVAVIAYFAYELITTRRVANVVKSLPGLAIVALLNVAFIVGVLFAQNLILDREFRVDRIQSVQIVSYNNNNWWDGHLPYEALQAREVVIADDQLTAALIDGLASYTSLVRGGQHASTHNPITVAFETSGGRTVLRQFHLIAPHGREVDARLDQTEAYRAAFVTPPENPADISGGWNAVLTPAAWQEIYDVFREEVMALGVADGQMVRGDLFGMLHFYTDFTVQGFVGSEPYSSRYHITELTPRTADLFIRHANAANLQDIQKVLEQELTGGDGVVHWFNVSSPQLGNGLSWDRGMSSDQEILALLLDAVIAQGTTPLNRDDLFIQFTINASMGHRSVNGEFFFNTDNEEILAFFDEAY